MKSSSEWLCDEVLTRQCPCLGLSIHGESMGTSGFDGFRQKQEYAGIYPGLAPRRVKTYILLVWSCIACIVGAVTMVAQMKSGYGQKEACASLCARGRWDLCEIRCLLPSWPPLLALIWGARSRDPVQVGYRCMRTLISLGLRLAILFLDYSRYANDEDPRGHSLITMWLVEVFIGTYILGTRRFI
jgi:hypothetical protein